MNIGVLCTRIHTHAHVNHRDILLENFAGPTRTYVRYTRGTQRSPVFLSRKHSGARRRSIRTDIYMFVRYTDLVSFYSITANVSWRLAARTAPSGFRKTVHGPGERRYVDSSMAVRGDGGVVLTKGRQISARIRQRSFRGFVPNAKNNRYTLGVEINENITEPILIRP